ncbi:uncharacterized protein ACNS7B_016885 [Menidia menidia]
MDETILLAAVAILSLALMISLCINVKLCIKQQAMLRRGTNDCHYPPISERDNPSQTESHYFHGINYEEQQENPDDHEEQQENPIYGNITTERQEVCYETMTSRRTKMYLKPSEPDLNYASLDLKIAKKRKMKNRHQQGHLQGRNKPQEQPSSPANAFSEMDVDVDAHLPSKDINTMVSHSSIYLNSQQIAQETEELEMEMGREREREREGEGGSRDWEGDGESQERMERDDSCTGNAKLSESENSPNCSDHF